MLTRRLKTTKAWLTWASLISNPFQASRVQDPTAKVSLNLVDCRLQVLALCSRLAAVSCNSCLSWYLRTLAFKSSHLWWRVKTTKIKALSFTRQKMSEISWETSRDWGHNSSPIMVVTMYPWTLWWPIRTATLIEDLGYRRIWAPCEVRSMI